MSRHRSRQSSPRRTASKEQSPSEGQPIIRSRRKERPGLGDGPWFDRLLLDAGRLTPSGFRPSRPFSTAQEQAAFSVPTANRAERAERPFLWTITRNSDRRSTEFALLT
jgi:hypothetical protein